MSVKVNEKKSVVCVNCKTGELDLSGCNPETLKKEGVQVRCPISTCKALSFVRDGSIVSSWGVRNPLRWRSTPY